MLRELRRRQVVESARELTPGQRIAQSEALMTFCERVRPGSATTDEPPELWLQLLAKLRRCGRDAREREPERGCGRDARKQA